MKRTMKATLALTSLTLAALATGVTCYAGTKVTVGKAWPAGSRVSIDEVDHGDWDQLLRKYVDQRGYVNYTAWKASAADVQALDRYLGKLSQAEPGRRAGTEAKLAFWINAYNAVTIKGMLREYPTTSIRNHTAKLFGYNIWHDLLLVVGSEQVSLNHIEHEILRKMKEPRIHFAIVCASVGCPALLNRAYTAENLEAQLKSNTQAFFADREKFRYDASARTFYLSPILSWFATDFGSNTAAQLAAIAPYLPDDTARRLARSGSVSVSYLDYDWSINDQAKLSKRSR